jgi:hypothetical protein
MCLAYEAGVDVPTVRERLQDFRKRRRFTRRQLADALSTPLKTLDSWLYEGHTPPGAMISLLHLIERDPHVRRQLGLIHPTKIPRGRPFERGHPYRFGDPRREAALKEARKRKKAKAKS